MINFTIGLITGIIIILIPLLLSRKIYKEDQRKGLFHKDFSEHLKSEKNSYKGNGDYYRGGME